MRSNQLWMLTIMVLGLLLNQPLDPAACAPTGPADAQATILVRDADGTPLPMTSVDLYVVPTANAPVRVADVLVLRPRRRAE